MPPKGAECVKASSLRLPVCNSLKDSVTYHLFKLLEQNPGLSQRQLAREMGISLGKTNYCLRALIDRGWIKAENFRQSPNKTRFTYILTPKGLEEKSLVTARFLRQKLQEYEKLKAEIEQLLEEAGE